MYDHQEKWLALKVMFSGIMSSFSMPVRSLGFFFWAPICSAVFYELLLKSHMASFYARHQTSRGIILVSKFF